MYKSNSSLDNSSQSLKHHKSILYNLSTTNLTSFANALHDIIIKNGFLVPSSANIFAPSNFVVDNLILSYESDFMNFCSYHIMNNNYSFDVHTSFFHLQVTFNITYLEFIDLY